MNMRRIKHYAINKLWKSSKSVLSFLNITFIYILLIYPNYGSAKSSSSSLSLSSYSFSTSTSSALSKTSSTLSTITTSSLPTTAISPIDYFENELNTNTNINNNKNRFKHNRYNVTITENSIGKTYVTQVLHEDLMGIQLSPNIDVRYRIINGDKDNIFKAEGRTIGGFSFLHIRTRTSNVILNREKKDQYELKIKAILYLSHQKNLSADESETTVHVRVLDRNDLSPMFLPALYQKTVPEDLPIHQSIVKVTAEDADLGINGEIYYSFLEENNHFAIHPSTGVISLLQRLKFNENSHFEFIVLASDRGSAINHYNQPATKAKVYIQVEQVNLYSPEIYVTSFSNIKANSLHSHVCAIVKVHDKDDGINGKIKALDISDNNGGNYFVIRPGERTNEYFIVFNKHAKIHKSPHIYNITLRAEDLGTPSRVSYKTFPIQFFIDEDEGPIFTKSLYEISIPETAPPNTPIIRLKVTTENPGRNSAVFLEIVGGNEGGEFKLNPDSGMLYTQKSLDAESKSFYTLTVSAIDLAHVGGTRKQSSAKVKINIQDMNDNDPIFEDYNHRLTINENEPAGLYVTKLTAKDKDFGENSYISYSIANINEVPFEIDHFSGVVRTTALIDYETMRRNYTLRIRASDWGLPFRRQSEIELNVGIKDINDNRPQFVRIDCKGSILRQTTIGTDIFTLSAIDFDAGDFITYRMISGNEDGCFVLNPTSGVISIGCNLNDLKQQETTRFLNVSSTDGQHFSDEMSIKIDIDNGYTHKYNGDHHHFEDYGTFNCIETGVARRLAEIYIASEKNNMKVLDEESASSSDGLSINPSHYGDNFYIPEFLDFPKDLQLNETTSLGTTLAEIKAIDKDLGYNGKLVFGITNGDTDSVFRIDMETGEIRLVGYLDRERQDEYLLNITVYDLGQPQKSNYKLLPIQILDNNDNAPVIQTTLSTFRILENVDNRTKIFCLNATDADLGKNSIIIYSMQTDTKDFYIHAKTGCIYTNNRLDREKRSFYELFFTAKDKGIPSLSSEAVVNIYLEDINDNAPAFGVDGLIFKIREDIPKGTVVATIEATDADEGNNSEIHFHLKEDSPSNSSLFKIDKLTGVIRTLGFLDYEKRQVHNLIVSAIDGGTPSLSSELPVVIEVIDVNENRYCPEFEDLIYLGKIKENQPKGSIVLNATARDLDAEGPDSKISYSIIGGDGLGLFSVNDEGTIQTLYIFDAETKNSYWLTLCAQDHAIVPLTACVQVYVEIENVNDNVPLTDSPVYYVSVPEGSPAKTLIIKLEATDDDLDKQSFIHYKIESGNPGGYFAINGRTGEIFTTERKLDRENQSEHTLEIVVSDNGIPSLSSKTFVVVTVDDINDNTPDFDQHAYKVQVPSKIAVNESFFQVHAQDNDSGENGRVSYAIKSGKGKNKFRIDNSNGFLYMVKPLEPDVEYEIIVKAEDNGIPKRSKIARINIVVVAVNENSPNPPVIKTKDATVDVTESDHPGFLVNVIQATDEDNDHLWYSIVGGDEKNEFYIGKDNGNVLLLKTLDWETKKFYNLSISVTDGCHTVYTNLYIHVIDTNDNRPQFTKSLYRVNISENINEESVILQLHATDDDKDNKIYYILHASQDPSSLELFRVESITGNVIVTQRLDFEKKTQHVLIVTAQDQGTPTKKNYAKIIISVLDHNDHIPEFTSKIIQRKIPESAVIGSKIVQVLALDRDYGKNAEIHYSILTGNVGNVFEMDSSLGIISLASTLNINQVQDYMLQVKATDCGDPPLSSKIPVHIFVVMSENDPPKFTAPSITVEIYENLAIGTFVIQVEAISSSSIFYEISSEHEQEYFQINPSTGVITIKSKIDYEKNKLFNISVSGTNMASARSNQRVIVHILDVNDNIPFFINTEYSGIISEAATIGTLVKDLNANTTRPLLLNATDFDSGKNGMIEYTIKEDFARKFFTIDVLTGAIKLIHQVDYETFKDISFTILINDMGNPKLISDSIATVHINITNVNDCPPIFDKNEIDVDLYIPTYDGVTVVQLSATDADLDDKVKTRYDIVDGNVDNSFTIHKTEGIITTRNIGHLQQFYILHVRASDGLYSTICKVNIQVKVLESDGFTFQKTSYRFSTPENTTKISTVGLVNVIGNTLHENVEYRILNPIDSFQIGITSGALKTTGVVFDREVQSLYTLIIEAKSKIFYKNSNIIRRAIVLVNISILDINDNCPMFVNLPYFSTVSVQDKKGSVIAKVKAIDLDSAENGEIRYEMKKGNGDLFKIDRKSGELFLKQEIEQSKNYELIVRAYDNGITPCATDVPVTIKVVDKAMPYFNKQFYSDTVREDVVVISALSVSIQAESPMKNTMYYTIANGNDEELFEIDYRTGVLYVVSELDYERQSKHDLMIRATDKYSGLFAEVMLSIKVEDANDCYPVIDQDNYYVTVPENILSGSFIIKVNASDQDTHMNGELSYIIETENGKNASNLFFIDSTDGSITLNGNLDYEDTKMHHLVVVVKDHGTPTLSSKTNVWISVKDVNDNGPKFIEPSFSSSLSVAAKRGHIVTIAKAYDLDYSDSSHLVYKIINGNELQTFSIDEKSGVIKLQNLKNLIVDQQTLLNVSASDGIHTTYARVKITLLPENLEAPVFERTLYETNIKENEPPGFILTTVRATDKDLGIFSELTYEIVSPEMLKLFEIDKDTGILKSTKSFDREKKDYYDVYIKAVDGGGKFAFTLVKVIVEDVNDNAPTFVVKEYKIIARMNESTNTPLLKIKAFDNDTNENGIIKYKIDSRTVEDEGFINLLKINEDDGSITITNISDINNITDKLIQFFVQAYDEGEPALYNEIPISILLVSPETSVPSFEQDTLSLPVSEAATVGTSITKLQVLGNMTTTISLATETDYFNLSQDGELVVSGNLDREKQEMHYLVAIAETATIPPLYAYCEIYLYLQDENDNSPKFDSPIYSVEMPENMDKQSQIIKVTAADKDSGANGDVRYSIEDKQQQEVLNIIDIDMHTGWITLLTDVDRELESEYNFNVLATDNGQSKHFSKVPVSLKITDYNDNPTQVKQNNLDLEVKENAVPGTILTQLVLTDSDSMKSDVDFFILKGDVYSQFQIRKSGEFFVSKNLDREFIDFYNISILLTDGKFNSYANLSVTVNDVNDNIPVCVKHRYNISIDEGLPIGTHLETIVAIDLDKNGNRSLKYYLTGKNSDNFEIEKNTGVLKVAKEIDREDIAKYMLYAHAQDDHELSRECLSEIFITVNDINDNKPEFALKQYIVSFPEDVQIQTVLTKIHANDRDKGLNRKITYSLKDFNEFFEIGSSSGIVKLLQPLDRESIPSFNLTIKAEDHGIPKLIQTTQLIVNVLDINDNPPEFTAKQYYATVFENATMDTEVIDVYATSKDIGINAEISYYIIGGNEQKRFKINTENGIIQVNGELDYERTTMYFLTVQAIDGGIPPLTNIASVNISILDVNDNEPKFLQNIYRAKIYEDILVGDKILQILATDEDSEENSKIDYSIEAGDKYNQFTIDHKTGNVYLKAPLDREAVANYLLEMKACDSGYQILCSYVKVNIDVLDRNDNPPLFEKTHFNVVLQENKELDYSIVKFEISDADAPPNSNPYTFDIRQGNKDGFFRMEQDGVLRTAKRFNHKLQNEFTLQIRVFDNGTPPLYSDAWVHIIVIEESQYPPFITPLEITVNSFEDDYTGSFLGKVHASDRDKYDTLLFGISPTFDETFPTLKLFNISKETGLLYAISNLDVGLYRVNVTVYDGKFTSSSIVKVNVELVTANMIQNAVIIKFANISPENFVLSHRKGFNRAIRSIMRCRPKDVIIITLRKSNYNSKSHLQKRETFGNDLESSFEESLDIVFAVKKQKVSPTSSGFYANEELRKELSQHIEEIEDSTNLVVKQIASNTCSKNKCVHGHCESVINLNKNNMTTFYTDVISFSAPLYALVDKCYCKQGFAGPKCDDPVNACFSDPCPMQKHCLPSDSEKGYQCICPHGFSGQMCENKITDCLNSSCAFDQTTVTFSGKSYAHYTINKMVVKNILEDQFTFSLQVKTVQQTGTLFYASGKFDYNILEIVNGAVQFRFDLGSGEGNIYVPNINVADGEWHSIILERVFNKAKLTVDAKHANQGYAPGINTILNIRTNDVFIGAEVRPHPTIIGFEDIQRGFIGCMADIRIGTEPLPLYISEGSSIAALKRFTNVDFTCNPLNILRNLGICGTQPCLNGGICNDLGNSKFSCSCHSRFNGQLCEIDLDPCSSTPCLYNGRCISPSPGNYSCICPSGLTGKRCEFGRYCSPNPCQNGGICEEGDDGPHCMCRGYTGLKCEYDVDECENQPCGNGATCINEAGSFRCVCPSYLTGASCGDPLYSNSISTKLKNLTTEYISAIILGIAIVITLFIISVCCILIKRTTTDLKRKRTTKNTNCEQTNLNSLVYDGRCNKRNKKNINIDLNRHSKTFSTSNENNFSANPSYVNNLDILRSYGSAGEELEHIPFEYQKITRNNEDVNLNAALNDTSCAYKQDWCEQMQLKTFTENNFNIDKNLDTIESAAEMRLLQPPCEKFTNVCPSTLTLTDYGAAPSQGQYHWDCSDWMGQSHNPLPDITEVPGAEIADSSSFHSNESNGSYTFCTYSQRGTTPDLPYKESKRPRKMINSTASIQICEIDDSELEEFLPAIPKKI